MPKVKKPKTQDLRPLDPTLPVSETNPIVPWTRRQRRWDRRNKDPAKWKYKDVPAHPVKQPEAAWNRGIRGHTHVAETKRYLWQYNKEKFMNEDNKIVQPKWDPANQPSVEEIAGKMMNQALSRQIRKASEELINANKEQWLAELHLAAKVILNKAIEERDQNAMMAVWDRVVGKPTTQVDMSVKQEDTIEDLAARLQTLNTTPAPIIEADTTKLIGDTNGKKDNEQQSELFGDIEHNRTTDIERTNITSNQQQ